MAGTRTVQVQAETRGAVPEGAVSFAVQRVSSLLKMAPEPVLFARVKLTMAPIRRLSGRRSPRSAST